MGSLILIIVHSCSCVASFPPVCSCWADGCCPPGAVSSAPSTGTPQSSHSLVLRHHPRSQAGWVQPDSILSSKEKRNPNTSIPFQKPIVAWVIKRKWEQRGLPSLQNILHLTLSFIEVHSEGSDWKVSLGFVCFLFPTPPFLKLKPKPFRHWAFRKGPLWGSCQDRN